MSALVVIGSRAIGTEFLGSRFNTDTGKPVQNYILDHHLERLGIGPVKDPMLVIAELDNVILSGEYFSTEDDRIIRDSYWKHAYPVAWWPHR